ALRRSDPATATTRAAPCAGGLPAPGRRPAHQARAPPDRPAVLLIAAPEGRACPSNGGARSSDTPSCAPRRLSPALALGMFAPALWHYGCRRIVVIADAETGTACPTRRCGLTPLAYLASVASARGVRAARRERGP